MSETGLRPEDFLGAWRIHRDIEDRRAGMQASFKGRACIVREQTLDAWIYEEAGVLTMPGSASMTAERRYLWAPRAGGFDIAFDDGRPFHRLELTLSPHAAHWCDPDQYEVTYEFANWPVWRADWDVKGPRKDYHMRSVFTLE